MMKIKNKNKATGALALLSLLALGVGVYAATPVANASAETTTTQKTASRVENGLTRAIKVVDNSITIDWVNDCGNGSAMWGFMFANSPDYSFNLGDSSTTNVALDLLIQGESMDVYNNAQWSEYTEVTMPNQGAGWLVNPYSVNKQSHMTLTETEDGSISIAAYSEGGNSFYKDGYTLNQNSWKNGKTLKFRDLVDENGYIYWKVLASSVYPITVTDTWTDVTNIEFKNVLDMSRVQLVSANDAKGNPLYVASSSINANGYSLLCDGVATVTFTDGENTVTANVGENVVFPKKNYTINDQKKLLEITTTNSNDRFSIGDSAYGMAKVENDCVSFNLGIDLTSAPTDNTNFNICIAPHTAVQNPGSGLPDNYKQGAFSLFCYVTGGSKLAFEYYDSSWIQHTNTAETSSLKVGELNVVNIQIKKEDGAWYLYFDGQKVQSNRGGVEFDFNALVGDKFMNAQGKVNLAVVGWSSPISKVSYLGTETRVEAEISSAYNTPFDISLSKAYDANGNEVGIFNTSVTATGYSYETLNNSAIKELEFTTYGGVTKRVQADVANKMYADSIVVGGEAEYNKTVTVKNDSGIAISGAAITLKEGETDVTAKYEVVNNNDGSYVVKGINKDIAVSASYSENGKTASAETLISKSDSAKELTLQFFSYSYETVEYKTMGINDKVFTSGELCAKNGINITLQADTVNPAGFQLFVVNGNLTDKKFVNSAEKEDFDCNGLNGVRIIALNADVNGSLYLDILKITGGAVAAISGCQYTGSSGVAKLNMSAKEKLTFSFVGSKMYINGTEIYDFGSSIWTNADGSAWIGAFLSNGYDALADGNSLKVYADSIALSDVSFSGITAKDFGGMTYFGLDSQGNRYQLLGLEMKIAESSCTISGINIGHRIVSVDAYTAGGVKANFDFDSKRVAFGAGHTATITVNEEVAIGDITIYDENEVNITEYLNVSVNGKVITISGLEDKSFIVSIAKENRKTSNVQLAVAQQDVSASATLIKETYTVTLDVKAGNDPIADKVDAITVYDVEDPETALNVSIVYENDVYVISGIEKGTTVLIKFSAEGYSSDTINATQEDFITIVVNALYNATFTVMAGETAITDVSCITVLGSEQAVSYDATEDKFVVSGLSEGIRVKVNVAGYEEGVCDFSSTDSDKQIVLVAIITSALENAITNAQALVDSAVVSVDGSDIANDVLWVTESVKSALESAITTAQGVLVDAETNAEIEDAVTDLNGAVATYMGEQAYGTKEDAPIDDPEDDPEEKPNGGCFGAINGMGALALLSATAVVVAVISKKKRN